MPDFFTDGQGRVRPIEGGRGNGGGKFVAAMALAVTLTASAGVGTAGSLGTGLGTGLGSGPAAGQSLRTQTVKAGRAARKGQRQEAWRRMGLRQARRMVRRNTRCAENSFGQVRAFFARTPCRSLQRALLVVGDEHGRAMVVAIAWVDMRTWGDARRFKRLDDTFGTGNVTPIASAVLELGTVDFTGQHYRSRKDGRLVVIAEAEPVAGHHTDEQLDAVAEVAAQLPPPL